MSSKFLRQRKRYTYRKFIREFPKKTEIAVI